VRIVTVARKPCISSSTTANVVEHQAGALNIDACRVGYGNKEPDSGANYYRFRGMTMPENRQNYFGGEDRTVLSSPSRIGRWPANLILQHRARCEPVGTATVPGYTVNRWKDGAKPFGGGAGHEYESEIQPDEHLVVWDCEDRCPVNGLGQQSGKSVSSIGKPRGSNMSGQGWGMTATGSEYQDSGTAARFFKQVQQEEKMVQIPDELRQYLITLISPPPTCEPVVIVSSDLASVDFSAHADGSIHGMILVGDPSQYLAEIDRVLRPGAHLLLVASDEDLTGAEGACVVEDFGYEIRDAITIIDELDELHYVAKAPSKERHAGVTPRERVREGDRLFPPDGTDLDLLRAELEDSVPPKDLDKIESDGLDPETVPDDAIRHLERRMVKTRRVVRNDHPTIKSVAIMERLLVSVPEGIIVDPFAGSGSTGLACLRTGHDFIGIEQDAGYMQIADERARYWSRAYRPWDSVDFDSEAPPIEDEAEPEGGVFDMFGGEE
jgi:hypothetical protein